MSRLNCVYRSRFAAILLPSGAVSSPLAAFGPARRPAMAASRSNLGFYRYWKRLYVTPPRQHGNQLLFKGNGAGEPDSIAAGT